jgi:DNA-binding transcriptional MerR regulator
MSVAERPYLSIGEVLGLLLEEFPDVTISKIRFLESQGLIDPERTPSGYRKFYDTDVERLRVILREQRENFLPLKVIRDRLESGAIDDTGQTTAPRGIRHVMIESTSRPADLAVATASPAPAASAPPHPVEREAVAAPAPDPPPPEAPPPAPASRPAARRPPRGDTVTAQELCARAAITAGQLAELESFGLIARPTGPVAEYRPGDVDVAVAAGGFLRHGVEPRHLRAWKHAAEREASLFEQLILPLLRQRNPRAREQAVNDLRDLSDLGAQLRAALVHGELRTYVD